MSYEDTAPNISQLFTLAQFMDAFPAPAAPPPPIPEPDGNKRRELVLAYRDEYNARGGRVELGRLARRVGVPRNWADICDHEVRKTIAAEYPEAE